MREKLPLLLEVAVKPKTPGDAAKLATALEELAFDNPHLDTKIDSESGLSILCGTSEPVLEDAAAKLVETGLQLNFGAPQVAYREVLAEPVTITYTHKKHLGSMGQFAKVEIDFIPQAPNFGFMIENAITDGSIPAEFIPSVAKGLSAQKELGLRAGFPVIDFKATLKGGAYHEVDSSPLAFDIAARAAFRELARHDVRLVEPVMRILVITPEEFLGGVIGDLNSRRGQVQGTVDLQLYQVVSAHIPLANMFNYHKTLRSMCQGRAAYVMDFDHYEMVPGPSGGDDAFPGAMGMRVA